MEVWVTAYLAETIPGANFVYLEGVGHFAPLLKPDLFNQAMLQFVNKLFD